MHRIFVPLFSHRAPGRPKPDALTKVVEGHVHRACPMRTFRRNDIRPKPDAHYLSQIEMQ
jgi:hypothetical protein